MPTFARPNQTMRYSGRFSISSATASPGRSPRRQRGMSDLVGPAIHLPKADALILEQYKGALGKRGCALLQPVSRGVGQVAAEASHTREPRIRRAIVSSRGGVVKGLNPNNPLVHRTIDRCGFGQRAPSLTN